MSDTKPPITGDLVWSDQLRFGATSGASAIVIDGDGAAGPSPIQLALFAVAGCMAMDVVSILRKGRYPLRGLRTSFEGDRAATPPRHFTRLRLRFHLTGDVPAPAVERAIALSREKYCSVWHTFRPDIDFTTDYEIHP